MSGNVSSDNCRNSWMSLRGWNTIFFNVLISDKLFIFVILVFSFLRIFFFGLVLFIWKLFVRNLEGEILTNHNGEHIEETFRNKNSTWKESSNIHHTKNIIFRTWHSYEIPHHHSSLFFHVRKETPKFNFSTQTHIFPSNPYRNYSRKYRNFMKFQWLGFIFQLPSLLSSAI